MSATGTPAAIMAKKAFEQLLEHLRSMDVSLTRLLELSQGPRENLFAAGSVPFGGTVGVTPASSTVSPPGGYSPGVILPANPHRRGVVIQNLSAAGGPTITIGLGIQSPQSGIGLTLAPGASWDGRISGAVWPGYISIVASQAGAIFAGVEVLGRNESRRRGGMNLPM